MSKLSDAFGGTLMLRTKLLIAFAALALFTVISGGVSLLLMQNLGRAFSTYSDVTSPMLSESAALLDNARRMRSLATEAAEGQAPSDLRTRVQAIESDSIARLTKLEKLQQTARVDLGIANARKAETNYAAIVARMIDANASARAFSAATASRTATFDDRVHAAKDAVRGVLDRAEGIVNEREEQAKVDLQTRTASIDALGSLLSNLLTEIFPRLQNARKLYGALDEIDDLAKLALAQPDASTLAGIETSLARTMRSLGVITRRLEGRMRDDEGRATIARLKEYFNGLQTALDALLLSQRNNLGARAAFETGRTELDRTDRQYFDILNNVQQATGAMNSQARADSAEGLVWAKNLTVGGAVFASFAALALALWFSRRITRPLTALADHASDISRTGNLAPLSPDLVNGQYQEVERLTQSFNTMVGELAEARRRMVEWSESEIRTQYERLNAAIDNMPMGLCMFDRDHKLIICNHNYAAMYGIPIEAMAPGTPLQTILDYRVRMGTYAGSSEDVVSNLMSMIEENKPWYGIQEFADGRVVAVSYRPLANGGYVATHEDITERRQAELKIAHMAHFDALTDLPNRTRFRDDMVAALARVARGESMAVLCIDLDHFKDVNDTLGHPIGDALLKQVAERLRECVRPQDAVARLGGDEFAILQTGADQPVSATAIANRLIKEISAPFDLNGHQVVIGTSVGIAIAPIDDTDPDALLKKADLALYRAKEDGRGTFRFFEPEMDAKMQHRRALELDLRQALALNQFQVYYQPLVGVGDGRVAGFEALLRWHHPERGIVPPDKFIPLTEEIGLINSIGAWVLKQGCKEAMKWPKDISVAVNLSPVQFKNKTLVLDVIAALGESGLKPQRLELEITETVLLQDTEATIDTLNQLRDLGVRIAMDDFGTGYSSLGYLRKFPFDKIKIDRSFIRDLADKPDSIAIVRAVTKLGATLGIATTAEGVETEEQFKLLVREGCTEAQGYLFSKPAPAKDVAPLIEKIDQEATQEVA